MGIYRALISPVLDHLDSETWHVRARELFHKSESSHLTLKCLEWSLLGGGRFVNSRLRTTIGDVSLENPLVVGAGWDKDGRSVRALWQLGFAGVEVGTVTPRPQAGNPKPRQFMMGDGVALNRLGFNSPGMDAVAENLNRYAGADIPIGISIGRNKDTSDDQAPEAHAAVARKLYSVASYFVANVSSPNTPGLRRLQDKEPLTQIVQAVKEAMESEGGPKPLFVKIDPDLTLQAIDDVVRVVVDNDLTGIVATNTTTDSSIKAKYGARWAEEPGGLSGDDPDFRARVVERVRHVFDTTDSKVELIGVGGIKDADTAVEMIRAGCRALQTVTAIRGEGPRVAININRGIVDYLDRYGVETIQDLIGTSSLD